MPHPEENDSVLSAPGQESYERNMNFVAGAVGYNRYLVDSVRRFLGDRVLDVGCGIGSTTALLERPYVVGLDRSKHYLARFRQRLHEIPVIEGDISSFDDADIGRLRAHRLDTIFCSNVLEHIEDDRTTLRNMHAILEEGGRLVLLVPCYPFLYGSLDEADLHFRRYDRASLRAKLQEAGFRLEDEFYLNFPGIFWWYLNAKILRRRTVNQSEGGLTSRMIPLVSMLDKLLRNSMGLSLIEVATK
jgi:SAM-dependent methyltransferase